MFITLLTVVRVVDLRQLVVAYVGRISLKREPQVNKPAVRAFNDYLYKIFGIPRIQGYELLNFQYFSP